MEALQKQPLAFSSDPSLIAASSRLILETQDGAMLNLEVFDRDHETSSSSQTADPRRMPVLLVVPGVCESIETKGIQAIVKAARECRFRGKVVVMELQGHGLSSGPKCLCPDFDRLVRHVMEAIELLVKTWGNTIQLFLTGTSMGGALILYAAQALTTTTTSNTIITTNVIQGVAPIAPSVGVDPSILPPRPLIYGLSVLAYVAPKLKVSLAPYEDPSHYNCPSTTKRNYQGHWPLATSKMLLDLTATKAPRDIQQGKLSLSKVPCVLVIAGAKDIAVPLDSIQTFYKHVECDNKQLKQLPQAGHDPLFESESANEVTKTLFDWIDQSLLSSE
jgi:alpha-beta hydrolase superfamily lysophospholipase